MRQDYHNTPLIQSPPEVHDLAFSCKRTKVQGDVDYIAGVAMAPPHTLAYTVSGSNLTTPFMSLKLQFKAMETVTRKTQKLKI